MLEMQQCNLFNLPENYNMRYWMYHLMTWTYLPQVAVDESTGKIVGYVLSKMENDEDGDIAHGHITSLSVLRDYRKLGIATKLMRATHMQMQTIYGAKYCSLHVRVSNRAALGMYSDVLKYEIIDIEPEYYADKEDAYDMILFYDRSVRDKVIADMKEGYAKKKLEKEQEKEKVTELPIKPSTEETKDGETSSEATKDSQ